MFTHDQLVAAEKALELDAVEAGRTRYREMVAQSGQASSLPGQALIRRTIDSVIAGITDWQADAVNGKAGRSVGLAKFISQFDADEVAFVVLRHVVDALHTTDVRLTSAAMKVTSDLEAIDVAERLKAKDRQAYRRYIRAMQHWRDPKRRLAVLKSQGEYVGAFSLKAGYGWTDSERLQVGVRLLEIAQERTGIFETVLSSAGSDSVTARDATFFIRATASTREWMQRAHELLELTRPLYYPMVVPPLDWTDNSSGGYLSNGKGFRRPLVKSSPGNFRAEMNAAEIPLVTEAINALQRVPFAVNEEVLKVVEENLSRGSCTGLPKVEEEIPLPARYEWMDKVPQANWTAEQADLFKAWKKETRLAKAGRGLMEAVARTTRTTAEIARKMSPFPAVYFPIQLDFRGRAYPMPLYLQPQGDDLAKGLLCFADKVPLGETGLKWLAVHIANCFGGSTKLDKQAFGERIQWTRENHDEIVADAADPFRPHAYWTQADSPFQFLAAAFEWAAMAKHAAETGDASTFESRIPVGLDGSCNGLQHFSAMLRDEVGGRATNLVPTEKPSDIYTLVAEEVNRMIELDLTDEEKAEFARFWMAKGVTRKWTKRNTMTVPYGVTRIGMKDQLWQEVGLGKQNSFFGENIDHGKTMGYLADCNWTAIGKVVVAARAAMDWLQGVARIASRSGAPILWMTPDGLPVMQRYCKQDEVTVNICGTKHRLQLTLRPYTDKLNPSKQSLAVAPNFVHSIDASHMRAVARRLVGEGISSMSMVHDSFAVHAGRVERLSTIIREEFVALHALPLLARFLDGVLPALGEDAGEIPAMPASGSLDLDAVLKADYFFA